MISLFKKPKLDNPGAALVRAAISVATSSKSAPKRAELMEILAQNSPRHREGPMSTADFREVVDKARAREDALARLAALPAREKALRSRDVALEDHRLAVEAVQEATRSYLTEPDELRALTDRVRKASDAAGLAQKKLEEVSDAENGLRYADRKLVQVAGLLKHPGVPETVAELLS